MPIYEYECAACRKTFERLERSMSNASTSAAKPAACPTCGSERTRRKPSTFAAVATTSASSTPSGPPQGCGRCGGPGPCGFDG